MLVGSYRLVACGSAFCDARDLPAPATPLTTASASIQVVTSFNWTEGKIQLAKVDLTGYPFCVFNTLNSWQVRLLNYENWVSGSTATATVTWTKTAETSVTGTNGSYLRPSTSIVLATNVSWKARQYTFTYSTSSGTHVLPVTTTTSYQQQFDCCGNNTNYVDFDSISPGSTASRSIVYSPTQFLTWLAACTNVVNGITLTMTAAGAALAPWRVVVEAGVVKFTDKNNNTTTYAGTIPSVVSAINVWPTAGGKYFTAAKPSNVTTNALTTDLKDYVSPPLNVTTCSTGLPLVGIGDKLAPSTTGAGYTSFPFDVSAYPDDENGLVQFITTPWYPKTTFFQEGDRYYITDEFDGWVGFPGTGTNGWLKTPGSSVQSSSRIVSEATKFTYTQTLVQAECKPPELGELPCIVGSDPFACNAPAYSYTPYLTDCNNNAYPPGCFPYGVCWCEHLDTVEETVPEVEVPAIQTLTGSFVIS
jgi:hypothetical protein